MRTALRPACAGNDAEARFRQSDLRIFRGDPQIACDRDLAAAAERANGNDVLIRELVSANKPATVHHRVVSSLRYRWVSVVTPRSCRLQLAISRRRRDNS
jgi:hypothetical protein